MPNKSLVVPLVFAATVAAALAFNPSPEQHRAKIKSEMAQRSKLNALLGLGSLTALVSSYHSLGVMSYTMVDEKTVSVGAFGLVIVP
jgi:hypothetical protein